MNPLTHCLISWSVANAGDLNPRERAFVVVSGLAPDIDGLGILADWATKNSPHPLNWWGEFHHTLGHNLLFCLVLMGIGAYFSRKKTLLACLVFASVHLHLLGDIIGARGPDGYQWPVPYLWPFFQSLQLQWSGQWALDAWPNFVITAGFILLTLYMAWKKGFCFFEIICPKADRALIKTLQNRFGLP